MNVYRENFNRRPFHRGVMRGRGYKRRGRPGVKHYPPHQNFQAHKGDSYSKEVRCSEQDVGITEYVGNHKGFSAVIKQRYSDFHVSEVDMKGQLVELTSLVYTPPSSGEKKSELKDYDQVLSKEVQAKLMLLAGADFPEVEIEVTEMNKDERKKIHEAVKNCFGSRLVSNTIDRGDQKFMVIGKPRGKQRVEAWPQGIGMFVHFVLYKENMDTMEAANIISQRLRIPIGKFAYAGTKDRRAKTTQLACVPRVHPKKLSELNGTIKGIAIGNYDCRDAPLRLGDLKGNRFRIVLRNITVPDSDVEEAATSLREKGFINYYGLQRFGSTSVPTHHVGRALLLGRWKEAVELILKPRKNDGIHSRNKKGGQTLEATLGAARRIWWETRDANAALKALDRRPRGVEGHLLYGLKRRSPNDLVNALESIPLNTRLMYLHSYQSYIWNHITSRRVKEFGLVPMDGDLVLVEGELEKSTENVEEILTETEDPPAELQSEEGDVEESDMVEEDVRSEASSQPRGHVPPLPKVRALTQEDLKTAKIEDIVLPLPGYDVVYPNNVVAQWYEGILALDGLSSETMRQNVRKYSLRGTYRKLIDIPKEFKWHSAYYDDVTVELIQSDFQKVLEEEIPDPIEDGRYKAVIVDFFLPSSSYATMALRELLKCDSSTQHQIFLNNYYATKKDEVGEKRKVDDSESGNEPPSKMMRLEGEGCIPRGEDDGEEKDNGEGTTETGGNVIPAEENRETAEVNVGAVDEGTAEEKRETMAEESAVVEDNISETTTSKI